MTVKLPREMSVRAIDRLINIDQKTAWLDREIEIIDLRLNDRISVRRSNSSQS